jgi:hypothetical protein
MIFQDLGINGDIFLIQIRQTIERTISFGGLNLRIGGIEFVGKADKRIGVFLARGILGSLRCLSQGRGGST